VKLVKAASRSSNNTSQALREGQKADFEISEMCSSLEAEEPDRYDPIHYPRAGLGRMIALPYINGLVRLNNFLNWDMIRRRLQIISPSLRVNPLGI
jgi:hypothetical protein